MILIIVLELAALLTACWLLACWRTRALRHQLVAHELRERLKRQAAEATRALAGSIAMPPPPPAAPMRPITARRAHTALAPQDAADLLLVTEYVRRRAEQGSALGEAARRARVVGETAAIELGIGSHLLRRDER